MGSAGPGRTSRTLSARALFLSGSPQLPLGISFLICLNRGLGLSEFSVAMHRKRFFKDRLYWYCRGNTPIPSGEVFWSLEEPGERAQDAMDSPGPTPRTRLFTRLIGVIPVPGGVQ